MRQAAQRFALPACGRAWTLLGSRKNSKPEKCLKTAQNPQRPVHTLLGGVSYQIPGIRRYLVFCLYSEYPSSSFIRTFSSLIILAIKIGIINVAGIIAQYEPNANGDAIYISVDPNYIGCRTNRYGPLWITFCPFTTSITRDANWFSLNTRTTKT